MKLDAPLALKVAGRMDAENAKFQQACDEWTANGMTHLILHSSELQYVSSMGLASFLAVAKG